MTFDAAIRSVLPTATPAAGTVIVVEVATPVVAPESNVLTIDDPGTDAGTDGVIAIATVPESVMPAGVYTSLDDGVIVTTGVSASVYAIAAGGSRASTCRVLEAGIRRSVFPS
jgi:hypothetical protein